MIIRVYSDLHLEFGKFRVPSTVTEKEETLVLAGDISVGLRAKNWINMLSSRFKHIVYVFGNHEYYSNNMDEVNSRWANSVMPDNVHILQNQSVVLDGVKFIGSTLWTDFDGENYFSMQTAVNTMHDYQVIENYTPERQLELYKENKAFIIRELETPYEGPIVVVTHHLPSFSLVNERYIGKDINGAYASNMDY